MSKKPSNDHATAKNPVDWRRIVAGSLTSIAFFAVACLYWPATATGFRSETTVGFSYPGSVLRLTPQQETDFRTAAFNAAGRSLSGERFVELLDQTKRLGPINTKEIEYNDFDSIFASVKIGVNFEYGGGHIAITLDGQGNQDQNRFLKLLAQDVAGQINSVQIDQQNCVTLVENSSAEKIDRAIWLANQIESDLGELAVSSMTASSMTASSMPMTASDEMAQRDAGRHDGRPFHLASSRKSIVRDRDNTTEFYVDLDEQTSPMGTSLESIDTSALQGLLSDIKNESINQTDRRNQSFAIASLQRVRTQGVGATPGAVAILLLGFASIAIGSLVAINWQPQAERGFDSAAALSESLGLPVLATIKGLAGNDAKQSNPKSVWANRVSEVAVYVLLIGVLVMIGFAIIDPAIRESTLQNPFDGAARIIRVFFGY